MTDDAQVTPPWWNYPAKEAWYTFEQAEPAKAKAVMDLLAAVDISRSPDEVLAARPQIEVLALRIAAFLGLVGIEEFDWASTFY